MYQCHCGIQEAQNSDEGVETEVAPKLSDPWDTNVPPPNFCRGKRKYLRPVCPIGGRKRAGVLIRYSVGRSGREEKGRVRFYVHTPVLHEADASIGLHSSVQSSAIPFAC